MVNETSSLRRFLVAAVVSLAILAAPVLRAFAAAPLARGAAFAPVPVHACAVAHRAPRLRRSKQTLAALVPLPGPRAPSVAERRVPAPARGPAPRAPSFAAIPDHPPASSAL